VISGKTTRNGLESVLMIGNEVQSNGIEVEIVNLIENVVENQLLKNQDLKMLKMKRKKNRKEKDRGHQKTESLKNQAKDRNHVKDLVEGARADLVQKINTVLMKLHALEIFLKKKRKRKRFVKYRVVSSTYQQLYFRKKQKLPRKKNLTNQMVHLRRFME